MVCKTRYHQNNEFTRKLLEELVPRYDRRLLADMMVECKRVMCDGCKNKARISGGSRILLEFWTIRGAHREPAYFTARFSMPVVQYTPPCFEPLHTMLTYTRHRTVEYIPCYMVNLNRVVLAKILHKGRDPGGACRDVGGGLYNMAVHLKGIPMKLDSANILLGGGTRDRGVEAGRDAIRRCFELCWWCLPPAKAGTAVPAPVQNMIYHTNLAIQNVTRLQKTLLRVVRISGESPRPIEIVRNKPVEYVKVDVALLVDDGRQVTSEFRRDMLWTAGVMQSVSEGDVLGVLIAEDVKRRMPVVVGRIGEPVKEGDLKPLLGVILWRLLRGIGKDSSLTKAGDIGEISGLVSGIVKDNSTETGLFYPYEDWNRSARNIKRSIEGLFPLYVRKNDEVHQLSPAVLSFIASTLPGLLEMREPIHSIVDILRILKTGVRQEEKESAPVLDRTRFQTGCAAEEFPGLFLENLPSIVNGMVYSRMISGCCFSGSGVLGSGRRTGSCR